LKFLRGDKRTALSAPHSLVISESIAQRVFGDSWRNDDDFIGKKQFTPISGLFSVSLTITGVFQDLPANTHLPYEALVSISTLESEKIGVADPDLENTYNYVRLTNDETQSEFDQFLSQQVVTNQLGESKKLVLKPVGEIHLATGVSNEPTEGANINLIYLLAIIGIIILALANQ